MCWRQGSSDVSRFRLAVSDFLTLARGDARNHSRNSSIECWRWRTSRSGAALQKSRDTPHGRATLSKCRDATLARCDACVCRVDEANGGALLARALREGGGQMTPHEVCIRTGKRGVRRVIGHDRVVYMNGRFGYPRLSALRLPSFPRPMPSSRRREEPVRSRINSTRFSPRRSSPRNAPITPTKKRQKAGAERDRQVRFRFTHCATQRPAP